MFHGFGSAQQVMNLKIIVVKNATDNERELFEFPSVCRCQCVCVLGKLVETMCSSCLQSQLNSTLDLNSRSNQHNRLALYFLTYMGVFVYTD